MTLLIFKGALLAAIIALLALLGLTIYDAYLSPPSVPVPESVPVPTTLDNVSSIGHPYLLFHDIAETPGFQRRGSAPWSEWEAAVLRSADSSLALEFSGRWSDDYVSVRATRARDLALAYQITKNASYAQKARDALLNLDAGGAPDAQKNMTQLLGYCLAYDWVQPCLGPEDDALIRDKLAVLADNAFRGLNHGDTRKDYIATVDYHLPWYAILGIAGATLSDYTDPHGLRLASTPADWQRVGTDYLFIRDDLHDYKLPLVRFQWDATGKDLLGSYKLYYTDEFMWWAQVYTHYYGKNFFDAYPLAREAFLSEVWESLPDHYSNDFITNGNVIYDYHAAFASLLSGEDLASVLFHHRSIDPGLLPYSRTLLPLDLAGEGYLFVTYRDQSGVSAGAPPWTSHLAADSAYQVFRENWNNDSEWLGLITYAVDTRSNRNNAHHDQLAFEYYGHGDLLLSDAGEDRYVLDKNYGAFEVSHNTIAIEDPRHPFSTASWSSGRARGIFKGNSDGLATPSRIRNIVQAPWMELVDGNVSIARVVKDESHTARTLSSPIAYERCVLFPDKDYFIVVDRLEGSEPWVYRTLFRPSSLNIIPTTDTDRDGTYVEGEVGQVKGGLSVGGISCDWASKPYRSEAPAAANASLVTWATTSPYGRGVELKLYSVPASEVLVEKLVSRVGGYNAKNEVFSPVVSFRTAAQKSLYRATVILSRYAGEAEPETVAIPVSGDGNAMRIGTTDYVYTGTGRSTFDRYSTDAGIVYIKDRNTGVEYTLVDGTFIRDRDGPLLAASRHLGYLTLKEEGGRMTVYVKTMGSTSLTFYPGGTASALQIKLDGKAHTGKTTADRGIVVEVGAGEHTLEITL